MEFREIPGYTMKCPSGIDKVTDTDFDQETASSRFVTFTGLIQQICKDFQINYIWYDHMCINQSNHEEKMHEIKQMHLIYANALCTVALVPEFNFIIKSNTRLGTPNQEILPSTQWCKRMWTLEEAYVSRNILFLGHNVHYWSDIGFIWEASTTTIKPSIHNSAINLMACTVLWYAKSRTSSKAHDQIFALANIYPDLMDGLTFSYDQPLYDLMFRFYSALAQKDISILWFGASLDSDAEGKTTAVRREEARVSRPERISALLPNLAELSS